MKENTAHYIVRNKSFLVRFCCAVALSSSHHHRQYKKILFVINFRFITFCVRKSKKKKEEKKDFIADRKKKYCVDKMDRKLCFVDFFAIVV